MDDLPYNPCLDIILREPYKSMWLLFYGNQLVAKNDRALPIRSVYGDEIWNGCYIHTTGGRLGPNWYRGDGTPVLDADVPKELKMMVLLLNL